MYKFHLIIPMGGAGLRFSQSIGFKVPKPLITIREYPFLYWSAKTVINHLPINKVSFIVLREHVNDFHIDRVIRNYFPNANIAILDNQMNGPVLTCYEGMKQLPIESDEVLLINDCDHIFKSADLCQHAITSKPVNGLVTFKSNNPQFSYIQYGENRNIVGTVEKQVVSSDAICGAYVFENMELFTDLATEYIANGSGDYCEFFMSGLYNILAKKSTFDVFRTDYHISFGTPAEYNEAQLPEHDSLFSAIRSQTRCFSSEF